MVKILGGTGHRPSKLGLGYGEEDNKVLRNFLIEQLKLKDLTRVAGGYSGMATGFDQAFAEALLELGICLYAAVAFEGMESRWPKSGQKRFNKILEKAEVVNYVCKPGYAPWKFIERDKFIVEKCTELIALYDVKEKSSGTGQTVGFAELAGKDIINLWPEWISLGETPQ